MTRCAEPVRSSAAVPTPNPTHPFPSHPPAPLMLTASLPPVLRALFRPPSMLCGVSFMFQPWIRRQMASDGVLW